jgi:hypothetical protein
MNTIQKTTLKELYDTLTKFYTGDLPSDTWDSTIDTSHALCNTLQKQTGNNVNWIIFSHMVASVVKCKGSFEDLIQILKILQIEVTAYD